MILSKTKIVFLAFCSVVFVQLAQPAIMSEEVRLEKLAEAKALLGRTVKEVESDLLAKAPSPFAEDLGNTAEVDESKSEAVVISDEELLPILAEYIQPTGIFLFGGEYYLIFKEKKLKSDSEFGVLYRGTEYKILIADITRTAFLVQLGEAQMQLKLK